MKNSHTSDLHLGKRANEFPILAMVRVWERLTMLTNEQNCLLTIIAKNPTIH